MKLLGAEYIVKILELLDAGHLFAYPGGAILPIYDALAETKLKTVLVRHEQAASFAAQGYARTLKNKPGFCLATSGPGATNLVTGIADAYADSIPMIALTGQVPTHLLGTDAFQETDMTGICLPFTKKTFLIKDIANSEKIFKEAYELSINGRPGPVLIDIPKDVQNTEIELDDNWEEKFVMPQFKRFYNAHPMAIDKALNLLVAAKKPLILTGHGTLLANAEQELRDFVATEKIPTISTILGLGALKHDDPYYFDWLGMHGMYYANQAIQEADVIFCIGIRFDDRITGKLDEFAPNAHIIHADIDISEGSKNVPTKVFLHGDIKLLFNNLPSSITPKNKEWRAEWFTYLDNMRSKYPLQKPDGKAFTMPYVLDTLNSKTTEGVVVATDVGQHQMWAGQYLRKIAPDSFITSGGLGSMGFGLPAAMGAQAAQPNKEVWCISGDGSFLMNIQELITLVQEKWPVKIMLLDNEYLGMVRQWQEQFFDKNYSGVNLTSPDFTKVAQANGIPSKTVDNPTDLEYAIKLAQETDGPFLIHAKVQKEERVMPMVPPGASLSATLYYTTD
jgi:acetolactate synthase-1/2/3 large subunit